MGNTEYSKVVLSNLMVSRTCIAHSPCYSNIYNIYSQANHRFSSEDMPPPFDCGMPPRGLAPGAAKLEPDDAP